MKAIQITHFGGTEQLKLVEIPRPEPGPGEVLVRLSWAGVNFIDVYMRNGSYVRSSTYQTPLPMTIGMEGSGSVAALGSGVDDVGVGDRVAYCLVRGSYAEYAVVPAWKLVRVPETIPLSVATALMLQGATAHYLTHSAFPLTPGHVCLIHAGAGGVGQLLVRLAKLRGALVIATVSSPEKAAIARSCGADHCILYVQTDFRMEVLRLTDGVGVDVVFDSVGKDTLHRSMRSLKRRGLCILFGASSGQINAIDPLALAEAGSIYFTRPHLADYMVTADEIRGRAVDLFTAYQDSRLSVTIDRELPLGAAAAAHRVLEGRETHGKLLLRVDEAAR
ncbi:quinone oxidoreductase [Acidiphilium sp. AL]|uniref:quinone oxidoreductase family protein n=1 Tax=Acidiphilium sp. AL TaxID=2871704 RepID=UPI0021CB68D5|nr:quinone oxidoreductase [Acidiphilium sp. AL]MCU4161988.1 quinone oxidoreductase [Acidiphilium sp. AL]